MCVGYVKGTNGQCGCVSRICEEKREREKVD